MVSITVQGAYSRDYKTVEAMAQDFVKGLDFRGTNPALGMLGVIFSIRDLPRMVGVDQVSFRFNKDRDVGIAKVIDGVVHLKDADSGEWEIVTVIEPRAKPQGAYCRGCGEEGTGDCADLECVELSHDSIVDAFCPKCGDCRSVEPDARDYSCQTPECDGIITSPFELIF